MSRHMVFHGRKGFFSAVWPLLRFSVAAPPRSFAPEAAPDLGRLRGPGRTRGRAPRSAFPYSRGIGRPRWAYLDTIEGPIRSGLNPDGRWRRSVGFHPAMPASWSKKRRSTC